MEEACEEIGNTLLLCLVAYYAWYIMCVEPHKQQQCMMYRACVIETYKDAYVYCPVLFACTMYSAARLCSYNDHKIIMQ